jgi:hypothetical protein
MHFLFEWLSLIIFILIGGYVLAAIKREKVINMNTINGTIFKNFKISTPCWWTEVLSKTENEICFKRKDICNDWQASFIFQGSEENEGITKIFQDVLLERKIIFDEKRMHESIPFVLRESPLIVSGHFEVARHEGPATYDRYERNYYDVCIFRKKISGECLYAESRGPILNGFLEARYFEECLLRIEII